MHSSLALLLLFSAATAASAADGPFTQHFLEFLKKDPKANEFVVNIAYAQHSDEYGSFGGKNAKDEKAREQIKDAPSPFSQISHRPAVFIHGNSDYALFRPDRELETGWTKSSKGYTGGELDGLTYGSGDVATGAFNNSVKCEYVKTHRYFIESILSYTQASQVDVIGHSMGVTIARMVLQERFD